AAAARDAAGQRRHGLHHHAGHADRPPARGGESHRTAAHRRRGAHPRLLRPRTGPSSRHRDAEGYEASQRRPGVTMKREARGLAVVLGGVPVALAVAALSGCAPPPAALDAGAPRQNQVVSKEDVTNVSVAEGNSLDNNVLLIRELKIIDDNGQQGVFAKLS